MSTPSPRPFTANDPEEAPTNSAAATSGSNGDAEQLQETERIESNPHSRWNRGMVGQKASRFWPSTKRLIRSMRPEWFKASWVIALTVISVGLSAIGPWVLGKATDVIFAGLMGGRLPAGVSKAEAVAGLREAGQSKVADMVEAMDVIPGQGVDFSGVAQVLIAVAIIYVVAAALDWLAGYLLNDVVQYTVKRMRDQVEDKVNSLPLSYFDRQPRGELLSRVTNDIDNLAQSLQQTMNQLLGSLLRVVSVLAMMVWISPLLALVALISVPLAILISSAVMKRSQGMFIAQWRSTGRLNSHIEETFSGHSLVKVFGRQREAEKVFAEENEKLFKASFSAQFVSGLIMPIIMFIGNLNYVIIAVIGGVRVASGALSLGEVQAFIQYSRQFTHPMAQLGSMANLLQSGIASAERVFELLDATEQIPEEHGQLVPKSQRRGEVHFDDISFSYDPDVPLIEGLSLTAQPGQTVAIVGPTGAGKTTLVNLVMRFYELTGGRILLDGVDIAAVPRAVLRSEIGMVLQDTWLFEGTIRDNIAYGNPEATEAELLAAAEATFVDRFVHSLPEGYDTWLDEDGSNLSAGERQLVTIARAFLAAPALLILDEATSSVDTRTELLLQQAMAALRTDRTSFVIAHRLSTIRDADVILVMEDGAIVETGTHDELLAAEGAYARLYRSQFEAAAIG